jgi:predicted RNA-binding Zn-ribbon protein involved in translation (DUF1610 family)
MAEEVRCIICGRKIKKEEAIIEFTAKIIATGEEHHGFICRNCAVAIQMLLTGKGGKKK